MISFIKSHDDRTRGQFKKLVGDQFKADKIPLFTAVCEFLELVATGIVEIGITSMFRKSLNKLSRSLKEQQKD